MTRRVNVEQHRHRLAEIREIMNSMKTLAFMETRKLVRFIDAQQGVVDNMRAVAADLLTHYPMDAPALPVATTCLILIGSERGFCAEFNHAFADALAAIAGDESGQPPLILVVGRRLALLMESDARVAEVVPGASVAEEVPLCLRQLIDALARLQAQHGPLQVQCQCHHGGSIHQHTLLPAFADLDLPDDRQPQPPLLNLAPETLFSTLVDQYLFATLHSLLYASLLAENQQRLSHLDGAVRHIDEQSAVLTEQANALRQEEIIGEIEVILLSAMSLEDNPEGEQRSALRYFGGRDLR